MDTALVVITLLSLWLAVLALGSAHFANARATDERVAADIARALSTRTLAQLADAEKRARRRSASVRASEERRLRARGIELQEIGYAPTTPAEAITPRGADSPPITLRRSKPTASAQEPAALPFPPLEAMLPRGGYAKSAIASSDSMSVAWPDELYGADGDDSLARDAHDIPAITIQRVE